MKKFTEKIFSIVLWATCLSLGGFLIPFLYYQYADNRDYYHIEVPVMTNQTDYKPCDTAVIPLARTSLVNANGELRVELIRVVDSKNTEVKTDKQDVLIEKGVQTRLIQEKLDCDLSDGFYYIQGRVTFRVHGVEHNYDFTTNTFEVKK